MTFQSSAVFMKCSEAIEKNAQVPVIGNGSGVLSDWRLLSFLCIIQPSSASMASGMSLSRAWL